MPTAEKCVHHFVAPHSTARYLVAACQHCGLRRRFLNHWPGDYDDDAQARAMRQEPPKFGSGGEPPRLHQTRPKPVQAGFERLRRGS